MGQLNLQSQWHNQVNQIEPGDKVIGGTDAPINQIFKQIAERTEWLKQQQDGVAQQISEATQNKANTTHSHAIADITGLQAALNAKFGLRGLLNETDLNTLSGSQNYGVWQQNIQNKATTERHYPQTNKAGTLFVLPSAYAGQQLYLPMGESILYRRHTTDNSGTWGQWENIGGEAASLTRAGLVQLSSATDSDSETTAATSKAVQAAFDRATETARDLSAQIQTAKSQAIDAAVMRHRQVGDFEIRQFPDGTLIQTVKIPQRWLSNSQTAQQFNWALAFAEPPFVAATIGSDTGHNADMTITLDSSSTGTVQKYWLWEAAVHGGNLSIHFIAIGKAA